MTQRLKEFIKKNNIVQHGEFELASGKKSNFYCNVKKLALDSEGLNIAIPMLLDAIVKACPEPIYDRSSPYKPPEPPFQAFGGLELGSVPLVGAMLQYVYHYHYAKFPIRNLKGFVVRKKAKEHGTQQFIEGPVEPGMKVVILEDVTTTGISAHLACMRAIDFGLKPVMVATIINRKEGADELFKECGIPFVYLLEKSQFMNES